MDPGQNFWPHDPTRSGPNRWPGDPMTRDTDIWFHLCHATQTLSEMPVCNCWPWKSNGQRAGLMIRLEASLFKSRLGIINHHVTTLGKWFTDSQAPKLRSKRWAHYNEEMEPRNDDRMFRVIGITRHCCPPGVATSRSPAAPCVQCVQTCYRPIYIVA
jgi:hypothetical protein